MKLTDLQKSHFGYVRDELARFKRDGATAAMWDNLDIERLLDIIAAATKDGATATPPATATHDTPDLDTLRAEEKRIEYELSQVRLSIAAVKDAQTAATHDGFEWRDNGPKGPRWYQKGVGG